MATSNRDRDIVIRCRICYRMDIRTMIRNNIDFDKTIAIIETMLNRLKHGVTDEDINRMKAMPSREILRMFLITSKGFSRN